MKFRIVGRSHSLTGRYLNGRYWFYAQTQILGVWVDCRLLPMRMAINSYSNELKEVEDWVKSGRFPPKRVPRTQIVVKVYDTAEQGPVDKPACGSGKDLSLGL